MRQFTFTIRDELGIHARPAGLLAKMAKEYKGTTVTVTKGESTIKASQLMKLMGLGAKRGDEVVVAAEGPDEDAAIEKLKEFFEANL